MENKSLNKVVDDQHIHVTVWQPTIPSQRVLDVLLKNTQKAKISGWFFVESRSVEAILEGTIPSISLFLNQWRTLKDISASEIKLSFSQAKSLFILLKFRCRGEDKTSFWRKRQKNTSSFMTTWKKSQNYNLYS